MIDNFYFDRVYECRLCALPGRLSVDCDIRILFKLDSRREHLLNLALTAGHGYLKPGV
jgi:hypothetical protein